MIDYNVMEVKIKQKEAKVIKTNERKGEGKKYIKYVELHDNTYKLCPDCLFYRTLDKFTWNKSASDYLPYCKKCRSERQKKMYYTDLSTHLRSRRATINRKTKNKKDKCTKEEFEAFFRSARCPYTGRTLVDEWENPNPNPNLRLEIDHIIPVSKGGSSKPENLHILPRAINALKRDCTPEQFRETLDFIALFAGVKK